MMEMDFPVVLGIHLSRYHMLIMWHMNYGVGRYFIITLIENLVNLILIFYICLLMVMLCIGSGRAEDGVTWEEVASVWATMCLDSGYDICHWIRFPNRL